ncbi:hypothetical protein RJ640_009639 [Escallonia rubra]|uniref:PB1 domain-containing protein n=1 Tax=Escallonia rubra TaxID=112253 RepID=A0AA88UWJ7_9ASTE|nr:hypothetical protein RJ640_009639 [Escallonia rubra]
MAEQLLSATADLTSATLRRPFDRGYLVNPDLQSSLWSHLFSSLLRVTPSTSSLLLTEPLFNLPSIQRSTDEIVFEEFGFRSLFVADSPSLGHSSQNMNNTDTKAPKFLLFGQPILTEQQLSECGSGETVGNSSLDGNPEKTANISDNSGSAVFQTSQPDSSSDEGFPWHKEQNYEFGSEIGHCKVFLESEDVGRTLDLSVLGSFEELYSKLVDMFGLERSQMLSNVLYRDTAGAIKRTGDEPFSEFLKAARRLTIVTDSGSDNLGR